VAARGVPGLPVKPIFKGGLLVPECPYCKVDAVLVETQYGRRWECPCPGCDARVGVHRDSVRSAPLGTLARGPLRVPMWRGPDATFPSRSHAYAWLAGELGLLPQRCHFAEFDEAMCLRAVDAMFDHFLEEISECRIPA
jgi:hypothetical protein